jgi:hypothetical protein
MSEQQIADRAKWLLDPRNALERLELELEHAIMNTVTKDGKVVLEHLRVDLNERLEELRSLGLTDATGIALSNSLIGEKCVSFILMREVNGRRIPYKTRLSLSYV